MELTEGRLAAAMRDTWWSLMLRGIAAVLFGLFAWFAPGVSLATVVVVFGLYALVDGVLGLISAFSGAREHEPWGLFLAWGLISIAAAGVLFFASNINAAQMLLFVGCWAVARGIVEIIGASRLRRELTGEWMLAAMGVVSILAGVVLFVRMGVEEISALWVLGAYTLLWGGHAVALSMKARALPAPAAATARRRRVAHQSVRHH